MPSDVANWHFFQVCGELEYMSRSALKYQYLGGDDVRVLHRCISPIRSPHIGILFFRYMESTFYKDKCIFLRSIVLPSIKSVLLDLIQNCKRRMTYFYGAT